MLAGPAWSQEAPGERRQPDRNLTRPGDNENVPGMRGQGTIELSKDDMRKVEEALKTIKLASNQVPYSMIFRDIESTVVPQALAKGLSVIPYSPLQRGLLTGKIKRDHKFNDGDTRETNRFYKPENIDQTNSFLQKIKPIADGYGVTLTQLVINWTTRQPAMDCVLVGARDEKQVLENVKALSFKLTEVELKSIRQFAEASVLIK